MFVIIVECAPDRLRGFLSRWLLQAEAGVYIGEYSAKTREKLWKTTCEEIENGNATIIWKDSSGINFLEIGDNARCAIKIDGMTLVKYMRSSTIS